MNLGVGYHRFYIASLEHATLGLDTWTGGMGKLRTEAKLKRGKYVINTFGIYKLYRIRAVAVSVTTSQL